MRAAQLDENKTVINYAEAGGFDDQFIDPLDSVIGSVWDGVKFINPAPQPTRIPSPVSPRQIRQAMTKVGMRAKVEAAIAVSDQDTKDWYDCSEFFERYHPKVIQLAAALNVTDHDLDVLWTIADSL